MTRNRRVFSGVIGVGVIQPSQCQQVYSAAHFTVYSER
jgi:hypothetical protein